MRAPIFTVKRIIIFGTLAGFILYFSLNYSGFCFAEMRYLSDEEKIKLVFDYQNNRQFLPLEHANVEHVKYESFDQYSRIYPDCCAVNPGGAYGAPPSSFVERILGYDSNDIVVINFNIRYHDESGHQHIEETLFENVLANCGRLRY